MAVPAHSSPWMQPTTRIVRGGTGLTALESSDRPAEYGEADRLGAREDRGWHGSVSTKHGSILRYGGLDVAGPA